LKDVIALGNLRRLFLSGTKVTAEGLKSLGRLRRIATSSRVTSSLSGSGWA
jgi:hypothetical protein